MVRPALLHKVTSICGLLHGVLKSDSKGVEQCVGQLPELIRLVYQVIQRWVVIILMFISGYILKKNLQLLDAVWFQVH